MGNASSALPFTPGERVSLRHSTPWTAVCDGVATGGAVPGAAGGGASGAPLAAGTPVTIFTLEKGSGGAGGNASGAGSTAAAARLASAQNAARRLRALRHPGVLAVLASAETDEALALVTERATPLGAWLAASRPPPDAPAAATAAFDSAICWGLFGLYVRSAARWPAGWPRRW
jgi:hypothetical protein